MSTLGDISDEITRFLIESPSSTFTFSSALWTTNEVIGYLNQRIRRFLVETETIIKHSGDISNLPATLRHDAPADWVVTVRLVYKDAAGHFSEVPRSDGFQFDNSLQSWEIELAPKPLAYTDGKLPTLQFATMPGTSAPGVFQMLYLYCPAALTSADAPNTVLILPDELEPAIRWGVIADMLFKEGRSQDLERAQYAELRYQEGVQASKVILSGWL